MSSFDPQTVENPIAKLVELRPSVKWTRRRPPQISPGHKGAVFLTLEWSSNGRDFRLDAATTAAHVSERKEALAREALGMVLWGGA